MALIIYVSSFGIDKHSSTCGRWIYQVGADFLQFLIMIPNLDYPLYQIWFGCVIILLQPFFMIAHKFSFGLRSGELPGHSKTLNLLSLKNFCIIFDVWHGARPCWKMPPPSGKVTRTVVCRYLVKIYLYLMDFIIPLTGISLPVPLKVKQPQNIFFGGCFSAWSMWPLWRGSPLLLRTYWDRYPWNSKWLSSENITCLNFCWSHFLCFLPTAVFSFS